MAEIKSNYQEFGKISFANEVLATIVGIAACDVEGVAGMSGGFKDGIVEMLGRKNLGKGVKITMEDDDNVIVDAAIIVKYGAKLPAVCESIQDSVQKALENMTGLCVKEVNISVEGLSFEKPDKD